MQRSPVFFLIFTLCIAGILTAGCTSSGNGTATTPAATTTPLVSVTETPAAAATTTAIVTTQTIAATTTASAPDPILHRWVRQYPVLTGQNHWDAYEFKFYPEGTLTFSYGTPKMTSGNIEVISSYDASGTWTKSGNNTYLLHYLPLGATGAQIVKEYTYVPETYDREYARTIPEHIVSQDEIDEYAHSARELMSDEMMYPERAKID